MNFRKNTWRLGIFTVLALVAAACGGFDPTTDPASAPITTASPTLAATVAPASTPTADALTAEEERYLQSIRDAVELSDQIFMGFQEILRQSYPTREATLSALLEAGVGTPFKVQLEALEVIDPPDRFQDDHRIWVESTRDLTSLDFEAAQAVRDGDAVKFVLINGQMGGTSARSRLALSPVFCRNSATNPQAASNCLPAELELEADYVTRLNQLLRGFLPQFVSMSASLSFPLSLTADELGQVIVSVASETEEIFQGTRSAVGGLTPPEEMVADHERLEAFFSRALAIFQQAHLLVETGEPESAQIEFLGLSTAFCGARQGFASAEFKKAVAIVFQGPPGSCRGEPF